MVNTPDILPTQTLHDDINAYNINMQPKCKEFKACVGQDKTLIHKGNVFAYNNHNDEVHCNDIFLVSRLHHPPI